MQRSVKTPHEHDAFISYSHSADSRLAPALESGLEKLAKPTLKLRAMDVFRDETSLAANPGLWAGIVNHLAGSRWFVLMASPASAASHWCNQEILWWLENRSVERMLIVLTEGEIVWDTQTGDFDWAQSTALSPALQGRFLGEPLYVDLRWARQKDKLTLSDSRFRNAVLDLAAPIREVPKDHLDGEDVRQVRRNKLLARAGVTAIALAAVIAAWQAIEATQQRRLAEAQRDRALSRQLAAQASDLRIQQPVLSLLLAAQALAASPTTEASTSLLRALKAAPFDLIVDHPDPFWSLAVSQDGRSAVVGDGQTATHRVDLLNGAIQTLMRLPQISIMKATLAVAVSPDGGSVASGGFDQAITIWQEGGEPRTISAGEHEGFILGLAFSPDGLRLASAGSDGRVFIHDLAAGKARVLKTGWTPEMSRVRFSPDGSLLAAGGDNGTLLLTSLFAGRGSATIKEKGAEGSVQDIHFTRDASELFCAYADGWIAIFDLQSGMLSKRIETRGFSDLRAMTVSSDGQAVVTGHYDGSVVVWRRNIDWSGKALYRHAAEVTGIALLPDGRRVVSIGMDGRLFVSRPFDLPPPARERSGEPVSDSGPDGDDNIPPGALGGQKARLIASHPERRAFADESGRVVVLPRREGSRSAEIPASGKKPVFTGAFSPDGRTLYALREGQVLAWDSDTGQPLGESYRLDTGMWPRISTSTDGKLVAVATGMTIDFGAAGRRDRFEPVVLLQADGLRLLAELEAIAGASRGLEAPPMFAPDGKLLAVISGSKATLWDLSTLKRMDEAIELPGDAKVLGFTGKGRQLLLALPSNGSRLELDLAPRAWAAEACRLAGRALTQKEWNAYVSRELPYASACEGGSFTSADR